MEISRVWVRKDGVKMVIIPKRSNINSGDYVIINKMEEKNGRKREK